MEINKKIAARIAPINDNLNVTLCGAINKIHSLYIYI